MSRTAALNRRSLEDWLTWKRRNERLERQAAGKRRMKAALRVAAGGG